MTVTASTQSLYNQTCLKGLPRGHTKLNNPLHSPSQPEYRADMERARDYLTGLQYNRMIIGVNSNVRGTCDNHIELDKSAYKSNHVYSA